MDLVASIYRRLLTHGYTVTPIHSLYRDEVQVGYGFIGMHSPACCAAWCVMDGFGFTFWAVSCDRSLL